MAPIGTGTRLEGSIRALPPLPHSRRPIFHDGVGIHLSSIFAKEVFLSGTVGKTSLLASIGLVHIHLLTTIAFALKRFHFSLVWHHFFIHFWCFLQGSLGAS